MQGDVGIPTLVTISDGEFFSGHRSLKVLMDTSFWRMNHLYFLVLVILTTVPSNRCQGSFSTSWRPILSSSTVPSSKLDYLFGLREEGTALPQQVQLLHQDGDKDQCSLFKIVMDQQLYFEYVHYQIELPDLREFTLCMWQKFKNHTNDHILFSYAVKKQPRSILSWISNTGRSSYYMMSVNGHTLYRLNYPLQLDRWYHSCQSWNGRTGEWQIWVNDERVGRGFNNRLVGNVIKGGGMAISGQEQQQPGGSFLGNYRSSTGSIGMLGELTMVQLYKVALTAGKAHRDHKHHHAHHFENGMKNEIPSSSTTQSPAILRPLPTSAYLTGGQLNHQVKINPGAHIQVVRNGVTLRHPSLSTQTQSPQPLPPLLLYDQSTVHSIPISPTPGSSSHNFGESRIARSIHDSMLNSPKTINDTEERLPQREIDGRGNTLRRIDASTKLIQNGRDGNSSSAKRVKVDSEERRMNLTNIQRQPTERRRRGVGFTENSGFDYPILESSPRVTPGIGDANDYLTGLSTLGSGIAMRPSQSSRNDREPAEGEVRRVMNICDGCAREPFEKALIMSWRSVPKKLYFGARHEPAIQACKTF